MNQRLRTAIVGAGIGRQHAEAYQGLSDQFELLAVCDLDAARARDLAETYAVSRVAADLAELCRMDDLDVIDLCTPPHLHFEQIQQVLAAGKHAICEKPLVDSLRAVDELIAVEARSGRRVMPIFQYRFGHGLQKLRYLVDQGWPARPTSRPSRWRGGAARPTTPCPGAANGAPSGAGHCLATPSMPPTC